MTIDTGNKSIDYPISFSITVLVTAVPVRVGDTNDMGVTITIQPTLSGMLYRCIGLNNRLGCNKINYIAIGY